MNKNEQKQNGGSNETRSIHYLVCFVWEPWARRCIISLFVLISNYVKNIFIFLVGHQRTASFAPIELSWASFHWDSAVRQWNKTTNNDDDDRQRRRRRLQRQSDSEYDCYYLRCRQKMKNGSCITHGILEKNLFGPFDQKCILHKTHTHRYFIHRNEIHFSVSYL